MILWEKIDQMIIKLVVNHFGGVNWKGFKLRKGVLKVGTFIQMRLNYEHIKYWKKKKKITLCYFYNFW